MAYVRGPVTCTDSSASLIPCNLSVFGVTGGGDKSAGKEATRFGVIRKHFVCIGKLGSTPSTQQLIVSYDKLEDKNPSSYLTQVSLP